MMLKFILIYQQFILQKKIFLKHFKIFKSCVKINPEYPKAKQILDGLATNVFRKIIKIIIIELFIIKIIINY